MGIGKFWIKHGPGSPGSIAKSVIKNFVKLKQQFPTASKEELLSLTLKHRVNTYQKLGLRPLHADDQKKLLDKANGKLLSLILLVIYIENHTAYETILTYSNIRQSVFDVISDVVLKYAPGID